MKTTKLGLRSNKGPQPNSQRVSWLIDGKWEHKGWLLPQVNSVFNNSGAVMPWLPLTVQHDYSPNPNWNPYYPPSIDLTENGFYEALSTGVVTVYYYNCGIRCTKEATSNVAYAKNDVTLLDLEDEPNTVYIFEDNRVPSGEATMRCIVGWTSVDKASPDGKSELATEWRKGMK